MLSCWQVETRAHLEQLFALDATDATLRREQIEAMPARLHSEPPSESWPFHCRLIYRIFTALYQVFYYDSERAVDSRLKRALQEEQLVVLASLVVTKENVLQHLQEQLSPVSEKGDGASQKGELDVMVLDGLWRLCRKRWQATLFLLCDAMVLSANSLEGPRLSFIKDLGTYFEQEGCTAHDITKWSRDNDRMDAVNIYLLWCEVLHLNPGDSANERAMLALADQKNETLSRRLINQDLMMMLESSSYEWLNVKELLKRAQKIRSFYPSQIRLSQSPP